MLKSLWVGASQGNSQRIPLSKILPKKEVLIDIGFAGTPI
jgi:hypothetical protein